MAPTKVLFLTNAELGEANVCLAVSDALVKIAPDVEVHFASFEGLEKSVHAACDFAHRSSPQSKRFVFHRLAGIAMPLAMRQHMPSSREGQYIPPSFALPPGFRNTPKFFKDMGFVVLCWNGPQVVEIYESVRRVLAEVQPDITAVNSLFAPGLSACRHLNISHLVLSPNSIKDFAATAQPGGQIFWKYPCLGSGLPYPIPWHLVPLNIYFVLALIYYHITDNRRAGVGRYFLEKTGAKLVAASDLAVDTPPGIRILIGSREELDYPFRVLPEFITPCGIIVRPAAPVAEVDPNLQAWLERGRTVYINLGTHALVTEDEAAEMALALRVLLDQAASTPDFGRLQVLWKLKKSEDYPTNQPGCKLHQILGREMVEDRVRLLEWIIPEPIAVLSTGRVVCFVNHGGASSFNEGVSTGVPQIILPQWADCYDFANRVEMLGIGRWGSKTMKPRWSSAELAPQLADVVLGKCAEDILRKARELSVLCAERGGGRIVAAKLLLKAVAN